jgi:hypothetical protein
MEDNPSTTSDQPGNRRRPSARPDTALVLPSGGVGEMVYDPEDRRTSFCIFENGSIRYEPGISIHGERIVPYAPTNNLIRHHVVLFPSAAEEYGTEADLAAEIRSHLHRYVDLSPAFETIATYYVLLAWRYDDFAELPYVRVRGDAGSGKTRFLLAVGSLCYKPIFATGASTVSPLFRMLDGFRGTLVLDESDFFFSDERAEIVKILNNGNAKGFPVLRSEVTRQGEVNPTAYAVFGPKLISTRGFFQDRALESRCITEDLDTRTPRKDIPINLPREFEGEALHLRNKLLMFRFRNRAPGTPTSEWSDPEIEPRLNQILAPLFSVIDHDEARQQLRATGRRMQRDLLADRGLETHAQVLEVIRDIIASGGTRLAISEIARAYGERFVAQGEATVTARWIGSVVRRKLHLHAEKQHGTFVIARSERPKLVSLFERYGMASPYGTAGEDVGDTPTGDVGDIGDVNRESRTTGGRAA